MRNLLERKRNILMKRLSETRELIHSLDVTSSDFAFYGGQVCEMEMELEMLDDLIEEAA